MYHCVCLSKTHRLIYFLSRCVEGCVSFEDTSPDMQHDICTWSFIRSNQLTWPEVRFTNLPSMVNLKICICIDAFLIGKYDGVYRFSISKFVILFSETLILRTADSFCLVWPEKVKIRPTVVKSGMIGLRTSNTSPLFLVAVFPN